MEPVEVAAIGLLIIAFGAVSRRIERWPLTMPMVFVGAGLLMNVAGVVDLTPETEGIRLIAEVTLAVILFSDAVRIDVKRLRRQLAIPARLLAIGMPLTIILGTFVNSLLFPNAGWIPVALLAAILAPTDAALGSAVVEDEGVPVRERLALNVESGVNDGLAVPVVTILTAALVQESRTTVQWAGFVVQQIGFGVLVGVAIGGGAIAVLRWAHARRWSDARYEQLATFVVPLVALFGAEVVSGNSFIAAFAAGLTFGSFRSPPDEPPPILPVRLGAFTEDAAQLFGIAAFFVFGNVLLGEAISEVTVAIVACALLTLTVGRMLPVWIALIGTDLRPRSRLFLGWFGPRGLASIVFGLLLLEDTEAFSDVGEQIFGVIALTVAASILLHGATASAGAAAYGRWAERVMETGDEADRTALVTESDLTDEQRKLIPKSRWSIRG